MSRVSRADWAPPTKWQDIPDKPAFADGPDGNITISDVQGLANALAAKQSTAGLAKVATTGKYADLINKPAFGSAAFADVSDFSSAPTPETLQVGEVTFSIGQQSYSVVFSVNMNAVPKVKFQPMMADANGEIFYPIIQENTLTVAGFTFFLSGVPSLATGKMGWTARVENTPP